MSQEEALQELLERLDQAESSIYGLLQEAINDRRTKGDARSLRTAVSRLGGKLEGVRLAQGYLREML